MITNITVALAGRAAEELVSKDFSTGVEGDLKKATDIAYNMVCKWGMSEKLGALSLPQGDSGNFLAMDYNAEESVSEEMQQIVDQEVHAMLKSCYGKAKSILENNMHHLKTLANLLIELETVTLEQMKNLVETVPSTETT